MHEILPNLKNKRIILASASPRRSEILSMLGVRFEVYVKPDVHEEFDNNIPPEKIACFLAEHKANHYDEILDKHTIIITADTIVVLENEIINKPENSLEAEKMLLKLSGKKHSVYTGVCIKSRDYFEVFYGKSDVIFKKLDKFELDYYIHTFKPYDKAGAYGVQEWIGAAGIESIEGSYFNVMGLPSDLLYERLKKIH